MFDPLLVPTFLKHQAQEEGGAAEEAAADAAAQPEGASPPAKRRRRERRARAPRCGAAAALDSQGQEESEAERAEREAAAEEHLSELTLGWAREGFLAPWLRRLLQQLAEDPRQQALAERVWQLAQQWGDTAAWRPRVEAACATAGLPPPAQRHEWLPLATGWCVVFEVRFLFPWPLPALGPPGAAPAAAS